VKVVTSLDDDSDARPMDSGSDDSKQSLPMDTMTILIDEHVDAFRAVLSHMYTGRQPSSLTDAPEWLPDFVNLSWLYELPVLMNLTKMYKAALTARTTATVTTTAAATSPSTASSEPLATMRRVVTNPSFLSPDLADGSHTIATGIHASVGGTSSLSVSIGSSMMGSPDDHGSTPSSPRHLSPRGSINNSTTFVDMNHIVGAAPSSITSSMDLSATPPRVSSSNIVPADSPSTATTAETKGVVARPVVIMKVDPIILAARSNYFRIMFSGRWRETQKGSVHLPNLSEAQFRAVLSYCYRGYISLHECTNVDAIATSALVSDLDTPVRFGYRLIDIARFFGMPDLVHYVQSIMQPLINPTNAGNPPHIQPLSLFLAHMYYTMHL
jgi:hypothetical protein